MSHIANNNTMAHTGQTDLAPSSSSKSTSLPLLIVSTLSALDLVGEQRQLIIFATDYHGDQLQNVDPALSAFDLVWANQPEVPSWVNFCIHNEQRELLDRNPSLFIADTTWMAAPTEPPSVDPARDQGIERHQPTVPSTGIEMSSIPPNAIQRWTDLTGGVAEPLLLTPPITPASPFSLPGRPTSSTPVAAPAVTAAPKSRPAKRQRTDEQPATDAEPPKTKRAYKKRAPKPTAGTYLFMEVETTKPGEHVNVVDKVKVKKDADPKGKTQWEGSKGRKAHQDKARVMAPVIGKAGIVDGEDYQPPKVPTGPLATPSSLIRSHEKETANDGHRK
ncbi:MAG: hypothetical protein M1812_005335 [Candelaria pacifica]|nr:MAG: hypothetical protein M1812_005335 [Candelaria pacifica]